VRIAGTNSNLLARAYGVTPPARPASPSIETRAARVEDSATLASIHAVRPASERSSVSASRNLERLVAATVPGTVDFDGDTTSLSAPGAYTMYGRPADKNAAAVAVQTGRSLDITG
jgi:hypothetical protein